MNSDQSALKNLAIKEASSIFVVSDSHGRPYNLEEAVKTFCKDCDAMIFLGDGIEDLISIAEENYNSKPEEKFLPPVIIYVRGNGDDASAILSTDRIYRLEIPEEQIITVAGKKIFLTHGHNYGVYYSQTQLLQAVQQHGCKLGLFGHTHVPFQDRIDDILLLNPGSISTPRNHSDQSCATITIKKDDPYIEYKFHSLV